MNYQCEAKSFLQNGGEFKQYGNTEKQYWHSPLELQYIHLYTEYGIHATICWKDLIPAIYQRIWGQYTQKGLTTIFEVNQRRSDTPLSWGVTGAKFCIVKCPFIYQERYGISPSLYPRTHGEGTLIRLYHCCDAVPNLMPGCNSTDIKLMDMTSISDKYHLSTITIASILMAVLHASLH